MAPIAYGVGDGQGKQVRILYGNRRCMRLGHYSLAKASHWETGKAEFWLCNFGFHLVYLIRRMRVRRPTRTDEGKKKHRKSRVYF